MISIIDSEKKPIKSWATDIEETALEQAKNLANLQFTYRHVALMPDCHAGYGMPIGGVLATKDVVIPNAVGVDIGCGMCATKTSLEKLPIDKVRKIVNEIRKAIPVGFKHHKQKQEISLMPDTSNIVQDGVVSKEFQNAREQIGTLGGGNHFIEIQKGSDGYIWIMVHSGSRNIGKQVAEYYNKQAKQINKKMEAELPKGFDLAYLPMGIDIARQYWSDMNYCVDFAFANRKLMIDRISGIFQDIFKTKFQQLDFINIAHNYAIQENHFGTKVIVHRKGATSAKKGERGIIPGSQGTNSYLVTGKGNPESFMSCSHGAGRKMGRKQAQRTLDLEKEISFLSKRGIVHQMRSVRDLDEAPGAYKNIRTVMKNQSDLVDIQIELSPLAVIKG